MRPVVVIGYSGHAYVVCDAILSAGRKIAGYCDIAAKPQNPFRLPFIGYELDEESLETLRANDYFIAIGDNARRQVATEALLAKGLGEPTSVVHATAVAGHGVTVGSGSLVAPGSVINALSTIGNGVICNTHSVIEHECVVGDYTHVGPSATLAGNVHIADGAFVGANSVVREGVRIGSNSTVGAGSVVLRDVPDDVVVVGNPARILHRRDTT